MEHFARLNQPPLSPPGWVFPVVWTILFALMGLSAGLIAVSGASRSVIRTALGVYALQLAVNFFWSILFFNLQLYFLSFLWLVLLWVLIALTILLFSRISRPAAALLVPYLLWVTFAGYLNFGIFLLNK